MGRPKKVRVEEVKEEKVVEQVQEFVNNSNIEFHLDVDKNDPRLKGDTPLLPSLDD